MAASQPTIFEIADNGAAIRYGVPGRQFWEIGIDHIRVLAEYTTSGGPLIDDCFLIFECMNQGEATVFQASFYSENRDAVIERLAKIWKTEVSLGVA